MSRVIETVGNWWQAEGRRRFLWLPMCFGVGIGFYLGLMREPPLMLGAGCAALFLVSALVIRRARALWMALFLIAAGMVAAQLHTARIQQTVLTESLEPHPVYGTVSDVVQTEGGVRITLREVEIRGYPPERTPRQVRLSVKIKAGTHPELPEIGDRVNIMAGLRPPMGPALPHGFNFARYFYFREIGAVGFGLPPWRVVAHEPSPGMMTDFRNWRVGITQEILDRLGPKTGGVAAGLITGEARAISEEDFNALRASNLYHIVAISGEHMVIISGVIFIGLRLLALLLPRRVRLRPEVKTFAAMITLLLVTAYLFVTGLPTSAVRAYVMITLLLLAVILRRHVDPMRSLSITALVMLAYDPAILIDPGFILSFAATLAIVALVETTLLTPPGDEMRLSRALRVLFTMLAISVVAEGATAPFVIAQFNTLSLYGVLANMLATPLVSFFLMPTVALYFMLLPLGLHGAALWLMDKGIAALLAIAYHVSAWPHAQQFIPSIPGYGVALFAFGLLWLCLWQRRVRLLGLLPMVLGVSSLMLVTPPDLLVGSELKQVVVNGREGYQRARGRLHSMVMDLWANGLGYRMFPDAVAPNWQCDDAGCVALVKGVRVAFPANAASLPAACANAELVLTTERGVTCENGTQLVDGDALLRANILAVWMADGRITRMESSADWQGKRPWSAVAAAEDD